MTDKPDTPQAELLPCREKVEGFIGGFETALSIVKSCVLRVGHHGIDNGAKLGIGMAASTLERQLEVYLLDGSRPRTPPAPTVDERLKVMRDNFQSDGKEEERWIEHMDHACPHCGGSGHKDDVTPPAEPPVNETIFEKQDRVLHDMGNPQPKESNQWLREYAAKMSEATLATAPNEAPQEPWAVSMVSANEAPQGAPGTIWVWTAKEYDAKLWNDHGDQRYTPAVAVPHVPKAELEAWEMHFYALKGRTSKRIADLTAQITTARNDALEEGAKMHDQQRDALQRLIDNDDTLISRDLYGQRVAGHSADAETIRLLKTDTQEDE